MATGFISFPLPIPSHSRRSTKNAPRCSTTAPQPVISRAKLPTTQSHFLHVDDFSAQQLRDVLRIADELKKRDSLNDPDFLPLKKKAMSMVFAKPSARTRVSFETAVFKSGGHALCLGPEVGVNTREAAKDVSRVLSGMTDIIMARLFAHNDILEMAEYASVPVINGLTDYNHPCQIVADALTILESRGSIDGAHVVYVGDGNNIVHSWFELAALLPIRFTCACPKGYLPNMQLFEKVQNMGISEVSISHDPQEAVRNADFVYTDVWASMGQKEEAIERVKTFKDFQITGEMMKQTNGGKFLHCLPAERGRECTDEVMEADYSIVFQQAENRMHAQLAIILACMGIDVGV
ncbi:Aspartate/ornithine carbamoyltransferase [Gracilaria domingensis]|nr:Aspartate/ornithine carbamoyltransferase [Gracilaria domingensis]